MQNRSLPMVIGASMFITLLGGCATAPASISESRSTIHHDAEYMAIVERTARRRGLALRWVNPPTVDEAEKTQID